MNLDERRTRRGVYAVVQKGADKTPESDSDDDSVVSIPNVSGAPSGSSGFAASLACLTPISRSASKTPSASSGHSNSPNPSVVVISARSLRHKSSFPNNQLVTPPLSEDATSETLRTPTKRFTRSSLVNSTPVQSAMKNANHASPSTPSKRGLDKGKARESIEVKVEETESRLIRTRPSSSCAPDEESTQLARPMGPDGKPLPLCSTCFQVIPVISVDQQVVWGHSIDISPKKKKNSKPECPR